MGQSSTVSPDDEVIDRIVEVAGAVPEVMEVIRTQAFAGSDDANLLIRHVQRRGGKGAYLMIGGAALGRTTVRTSTWWRRRSRSASTSSPH